jgi:hypothetical protein
MHGRRRDCLVARLLIAALFLTLGVAPASALGKKKKEKEKEIVPFVASGGWEPFFHDDEGRDRAFLQPIEKNEDADWRFLRFTDYKGPRGRLAILRVENQSPPPDEDDDENSQVPLGNIEELFTTSLFETHRFNLIERKRIQSAIAEQNLGSSDRVNPDSAAKIGKALGADYLIIVAVTEWTPEKKRIGAIGLGQSTAEVALSIRVLNATTGEVSFSTTERATAGSWNFVIGTNKAPISYSLQSCLNKGAYRLATSLKVQPWRGQVADIKGGKIYINAGSNRGLETGMKLTALSKGAEVIDPETHLSLGSDLEAVGSLTITTVNESFSIAAVAQGCKGLKKGDVVEIAAEKF